MDNDNGMAYDSVNTIANQPVTNHDLGYLGVILHHKKPQLVMLFPVYDITELCWNSETLCLFCLSHIIDWNVGMEY